MKTLYDVVKAWKELQDKARLIELIEENAPHLRIGERPLPASKDWPNKDSDEVVAWDETHVVFIDEWSMEFSRLPRMQEDEMRGYLNIVSEIGEESLQKYGKALPAMPDNMTLTQSAYWAMGIIKGYHDEHDDEFF